MSCLSNDSHGMPEVSAASDTPSPRRIAWVDVARVLMMVCVIIEHLPLNDAWRSWMDFSTAGRMCTFFAFAGYFMARRCPTGGGAPFPQWSRAKLLLASYVVLSLLYINCSPYRIGDVITLLQSGTWKEGLKVLQTIFGIGVSPSGPLWFLRDLFLLTLAVGFLVRLKRYGLLYVLMGVCLLFGWNQSCVHFEIGNVQLPHPRELAFFALGIAVSQVSLEAIAGWLTRWSLPIVLLSTACILIEYRYCLLLTPAGISAYLALSLLAALWLERLWPQAMGRVALLGETVFFVYGAHILVIRYIIHELYGAGIDPFGLVPTWGLVLFACVLYLLIHAGGMLLKRFSPRLFDLLATRPPKKKKATLILQTGQLKA